MSAIISEPDLDPAHLVRGYRSLRSNFKEEFHVGVFQAIAAAAGCIYSKGSIDAGIDASLRHQISDPCDCACIDFQLKCTEKPINASGELCVQLSVKRYNEMCTTGKTVPTILVAQQIVPKEDNWVDCSGQYSEFRVNNYWINLTGMASSGNKESVQVKVPTNQVFDDAALIKMFAQVRKGVLAK